MIREPLVAACVLVLGVASLARADASTSVSAKPLAADECQGERYLVLEAHGELDERLVTEVRTDLATELDARGLAICHPAPSGREPAVIVALTPESDAVVIEVDDRVTHKRVARDLSLATIPANGRALAIAIAIDELIRASWAELELPTGTPASAPAPDEPLSEERVETLTVNARGHASATKPGTRLTLRLAATYAHTRHSFEALGGAFGAALHPWQRSWLELRVHALASFAAESARGDVFARGAGASLTLGGCLPPFGSKLFACIGARGTVEWIALQGANPRAADARTRHAGVFSAGGTGLFGVSLTERLHWFAELSVSAVLRGARATDGARTLLGVASTLLGAQTGFGVEL